MTKSNLQPTDAEMQVLQVLWSAGPSSVKSVNDAISKEREVGYTTTLKTMQIMHDKGLVSREKEGKSHIYSATVSRESAQKVALDKVLNNVFQGSAMNLVMQVLGDGKSDKKELKKIREYLDELDRKGGES